MTSSITKDKNDKDKKNLNKIFVFLFWLGVWQIVHLIIKQEVYVPSPYSVFLKLKEQVFMLHFWESVFYSIYRVLFGMAISVVLGLIAAVASSMNRYIHDLLKPLMIAIKSTPVLSFIIIALLWFSSSNVPIFICFLMCFPVIWTNVLAGIENVDKNLLDMAKLYRVKKLLILKRIYFPSVLPYFSAACVTSLGLGWKVSVAAEVLSHPKKSIGSNLYSAKVYLDSAELFAWTIVVILLSMIFEYLFSAIVKGNKMKRRADIGTKNQ